MLKTLKSTFKNKLIIGLSLGIAMILSMIIPLAGNYKVSALSDLPTFFSKDVTSDLFSNNNFSTSSSTIAQPSGWTASTNNNDPYKDDYKSGVVNFENMKSYEGKVELDSFWDRYGLLKSPNIDTSNAKKQSALMINASNFDGNKNYSTSKTISLEKNSFYKIVVSAYSYKQTATNVEYVSEETDPFFSIYLTNFSDSSKDAEAKFERVSNEKFTDYNFYIQTNENTKESLNLELWLGDKNNLKSMGAVFFSHIQIIRYSENKFNELVKTNVEDSNDGTNVSISLSSPTTINDLILNPSFENELTNWKVNSNSNLTDAFVNVVDSTTSSNYPNLTNCKVDYIPGTNFSSTSGTSALLVAKYGKGYLGVESDAFNIERFGLYKLTVWAKTNTVNSKDISIILKDKTENTEIKDLTQSVTAITTSTDSYTNGWNAYTFFIQGSPVEDKNIAIEISINSLEDEKFNFVFIDDIEIERVNYSTFSADSTDSNKFNLNNITSLYLVSNYTFNEIENTNTTVSYPLKPSNWTQTSNNTQTTNSGVVNKNYSEVTISNTSLKNNFLMIDNADGANLTTFTSKNFSLSANSYYYLSFKVATSIIDGNVSFTMKTTGDTPSIIYKQENISSHNEWSKFTAYIKTGNESYDAVIELSSSAQGEAYFDEIIVKSSTEETFNANKDSVPTLDYSNDSFEAFNDGNTDLYKTPYNWTANALNNDFNLSKFGITNPQTNPEITDTISLAKDGKTVLYINNYLADTYFYYTKNTAISLSASTYYKVSVWIKTDNITSELSTLPDGSKLGATVILKYGEKSQEFLGINTNGEYKEVIFYICPAEATNLNITLGLGNSKTLASGSVYFDNLTVSTIASYEDYEKEYAEVSKDENIISATIVEKEQAPKVEEEPETKSSVGQVDWLVIPSLITAIAIFVALVGFIVRKYYSSRKHRKVKTSYDRKKTLNKNLNAQEKIEAKQELIADLEIELKQINDDIKIFNEESNKRIEAIEARFAYQINVLESAVKELTDAKNEKIKEKNKLISIDKVNVDKTAEMKLNAEIKEINKDLTTNQKRLDKVNGKIDGVKNEVQEQSLQLNTIKENIEREIKKLENDIKVIKESDSPKFETRRSKKGLTNKNSTSATPVQAETQTSSEETTEQAEVEPEIIEDSQEESSDEVVIEVEDDSKNE